jgi:outer membrane immunogenic protein
MKKLFLGVAASTTLIVVPALAADMPVKAPTPAAVVAYNWTGLYVGANIGWVSENESWTYTNPVPNSPPTNSLHNINASDGIFGGHIGAQYQFNQFVIGAEAAISHPMQGTWGTSGTQCVSTIGSQCQARANTLLTAGGRLGWAWNRWLLFASGGWAQLDIETQELTAPPIVFDHTEHRHNGSYIGGGVEYAWTDHLILGIEYQHVEVDSAFHLSSADLTPSPPGVNGRNVSGSEDIVRGRISFKWP